MTNYRPASILALTLIASLAVVSSALAASAGDEYLPTIPSSGASGSGGGTSGGSTSGVSPTSKSAGVAALDAQGNGDHTPKAHKPVKKGGKSHREQSVALTSDQGGGGGDGSGSILLNPLVIGMIAAVVAAAIGMTLSRRHGHDAGTERERRPGGRLETDGPRTPDGEIVAGPDQAT